ncbi:chorismate-binding protein [Candidatus Peregrinibacteria bacterium]|nr:chorismate-binding protein [Candidatus Peregrinibacteria bacterium]
MDISELRKKIDGIDAAIVQNISERFKIVQKIAKIKKSQGIQIFQPEREVELLSQRRKLAKKIGVSENLIEDIFRKIVQESRKIQSEDEASPLGIFPSSLRFQKKELPLRNISLLDIFEKIACTQKDFFFLESLGEDEWSEYSFLGFSPHAIISSKEGKMFVNGKEFLIDSEKNPLEALDQLFAPFAGITQEKRFRGGLIGYLGTESARFYDASIPTSSEKGDFPDFLFGLFLDGLVYDRKRQALEYFTWHEDRSSQIQKLLAQKISPKKITQKYVKSSCTDTEFEKMVERMKEEIVSGNIFQIVPSRKFEYEIHGSLLNFYGRLREVNPSPHMYFLKFGKIQIIGSSPELVGRIEGERIETFPIAGTRSRGKTPEEDSAKAAELLADPKEVAEHMMLVDMARNDLGKVCEYGSVEVNRLMSIKKFSHVQHIVSEISGILRKNISALRGIIANFPMGTVCGSPRIEAMKILVREEKVPRGPYGGAVGFWSFSGDATFALAIRSLFVHGEKGFCQAGAGIVYDSVPEFERKEVNKKSQHVREILEEFE